MVLRKPSTHEQLCGSVTSLLIRRGIIIRSSLLLALQVGYMDKVLQLMEVKKDRFQLVAIACLIIAG